MEKEKITIEMFNSDNLEKFINYPFTFDSYKILLDEAYTSEQVSSLRYYLWVHSAKCNKQDISKVNNIANTKLNKLIQQELECARNHAQRFRN